MASSVLLALLAIQVVGVVSDYDGEKLSPITRRAAQCDAAADVVFLLERSVTVGADNFKKQQEFASNIAKQLPIGKTGVNVGAIVYGYESQTAFKLGTQADQAAVEKAIMAVSYEKDCAREEKALKLAREQFLSPADGGRYWVPTAVVLVTDRQASADVMMGEAKLLKDKGVQIIVVGVGSTASDLSGVATSSGHFFAVNSFAELATVQDKVVAKICENGKAQPTVKYSFAFKTSSTVGGAKTDDTVSGVVQGVLGNTEKLAFDNTTRDDFEAGHTDTFQFDLPDVGTITGILMNVEGSDAVFIDNAYIYKYLTDAQKLKAATDTLAPTYEESYFKGTAMIGAQPAQLALQSTTLKQ